MQILDLEDSVELMLSTDYKNRLAAEYIQTKIRYDKLRTCIINYYGGIDIQYAGKEIKRTLENSIDILIEQLKAMQAYLDILEIRARRDNVDIRADTIIEYYKDDKKRITLDDLKVPAERKEKD